MNTFGKLLPIAVLGVWIFSPMTSRSEVFTQAEITQIFNEVKTLDSSGARPAKIRETIQGVQSVKTGAQSRAELTFPDKSLTRLGGNTIFSFQQGTRELELKQGTILFEVPKGNGGAKIRTAAITAAITGTTGFYEYSPNVGPDGIIKFGILEGSATLFIKGRLGHFITIGPGQMVICSARLRDFNSTEVVYFEIDPFLRTCALIIRMGGLPPESLFLVRRAIAEQGKLFNRSKELFLTNLFIPGGGTEVVLTDLDRRFSVNNPLLFTPPTPPAARANPTPRINNSFTPPMAGSSTPGGIATVTATATPPIFGALPTITSPNPYIIKSTTTIQTDPTITTDGTADSGRIFRNVALDGSLTNYYFGSTSAFDLKSGLNNTAIPASGITAFKFTGLRIIGNPTINSSIGPRQLALISETFIDTAPPGGTFNLNALDGLLLGTVNGPITSGPQLSYLRTNTSSFYLDLYARGASSDINMNSAANFAAGELDLFAEHDVLVGGRISVPTVQILAGNNFTLAPGGTITAPTQVSIFANNVAGSPGTLISTPTLTVGITGAATFQQSGNGFSINTLPVDATALQSLTLSAGTLSVTSNINAAPLQTISLTSNSGPLTISSNITTGTFAATAPSLAGTGLLDAINTSLTLTGGTAVVNQGTLLTVQALSVSQNRLASLSITAPAIQLTSNLGLSSSVSLTLTGAITSNGSLSAGNISLLGAANVQGPVSATGNLTIQNLTVFQIEGIGQVGANTITRGFADDTPHTLTTNFVSAPGGILFNGADGGAGTAPRNGGILTLTANAVSFSTTAPTPPPYIGVANLNGGNAQLGSGFAGGNGGNFTVNATSGNIQVDLPISATTGTNSSAVSAGGAGGVVALNTRTDGSQITVNSTIDVSSNDPVNRRVSRTGGSISVTSATTASGTGSSGPAIIVSNSGALRSLLNAAAPGPGGTVQIVSAGGNIQFNGLAQADRGTVDIHLNDSSTNFSTVALNNANINADVVKIGSLGQNGQLNIGGGTINANSQLKLYAGGSNGTVTFVSDVTLNGGPKIISATTVSVNPGTTVTVNGGVASIFANTRNYVGGNGSTPAPGRFIGPGAPTAASTHAFGGAPAF